MNEFMRHIVRFRNMMSYSFFRILARFCLGASSFAYAELTQADTSSNSPVVITAGTDWIPLQTNLEIEPGSALDFSTLGLQDAPAGKLGRVIARPDGQFAFEKDRGEARRFLRGQPLL